MSHMPTDAPTPKDSDQSSENLSRTMQALRSVNENAPDAKENKDSMKDRDGRRIKFNEGKNQQGEIIRGVEPSSDTIQGVDS